MENQIIISQNDNQNIVINSNEPQLIRLNNTPSQNIGINENETQNLNIEQNENQVILIDGGGNLIGISDVLVNGVSVVSGNIAYVIVPTKTSQLQNDSNYITSESDPTVPSYVKQISLADINNWNNKQNALVSGSTIKTINNNSILGSGNLVITGTQYEAGNGINIENNIITNEITSYNDLTDLPQIPTKVSDLNNDENFVPAADLSEVAFTGSYASLSNTPTIPENTSDLVNDSGFITKNVNDLTYYPLSSSLATVATSGNYNDLSNKPTIPTVNDGILTIQKNGTTIDSFSANTSSNKTVNITVPTKTSDLTNDSGYIDKNVNDLTNYMLSSNVGAVYWIAQNAVSGAITNGTGDVKLTPYLSSDGNILKIVQNDNTRLNSYTAGDTTTIAFNMGVYPLHEGRSQCLFKDFTNNNSLNIQSCPIYFHTNGTIEITIYHNNTGSNGRIWIVGNVEFYLK